MTGAPADLHLPQPFRQFLLKVVSRCNLSCDYCYVYEFADQSWRQRPRVMPDDVLAATVDRIAEHVRRHEPATIQVILHGGEPLLAGPGYLGRAAAALRAVESSRTRVDLYLQTNGVLLDETFLDVLREHRVKVGVSLDGTAGSHDRHRRRADGRGSHAAVTAGLELLTMPRHRELFSGLLGVIDLAEDPVAYYEALLGHGPPQIDLLLPHGTWSVPPPGLVPGGTGTPYADWLIAVFDRWYAAPRRETRVRSFESIIKLVLGDQTGSEGLGLAPIDLVTVETDGSLEQVDTLKVAEAGAAGTGLHVLRDSFDAALAHPGITARQQGLAALADECRACPIVRVCGGGLYTHRHRQGYGFRHPSVYCRDLYRLITHVWDRVEADLGVPGRAAPGGRSPGSDERLLDVAVQALTLPHGTAVGVTLP